MSSWLHYVCRILVSIELLPNFLWKKLVAFAHVKLKRAQISRVIIEIDRSSSFSQSESSAHATFLALYIINIFVCSDFFPCQHKVQHILLPLFELGLKVMCLDHSAVIKVVFDDLLMNHSLAELVAIDTVNEVVSFHEVAFA